MRILVTGAAGFIGSHLVDTILATTDSRVLGVDNLARGHISNLKQAMQNERFRFIEADITSFKSIADLFDNIDLVFHLAAWGSVPKSFRIPNMYMWNNCHGTHNVFLACHKKQVPKVILASSSSVYENKSPYAISKSVCELYAKMWREQFGIDITIARFFNVYGTRQRGYQQEGGPLIPTWLYSAMTNKQLPVTADLKKTKRSFTYVKDVCKALMEISQHNERDVDVAHTDLYSLEDVYNTMNTLFENKLSLNMGTIRKGDILVSQPKDSALGRCTTPLGLGLEETMKGFPE